MNISLKNDAFIFCTHYTGVVIDDIFLILYSIWCTCGNQIKIKKKLIFIGPSKSQVNLRHDVF